MKSLSELDMKFIEISKYNFEELHLKYPIRGGYLKALNELNNGYRAFAVVRGNEVIGDMWYGTSINSKQPSLYHDVEWLGIDLGEKGVYVWDVYVKRSERKNSVAFYLLSLALHSLRERGFTRIYGSHWVGNSLASFLYRIFRFKELKRMKVSRFLFFRRVKEES
jgi:ribosomal protein S18 acetylase RimI-like enzyme